MRDDLNAVRNYRDAVIFCQIIRKIIGTSLNVILQVCILSSFT